MPALLIRFLPYILIGFSIMSFIGYVYWKGRSDKADEVELENLKVTVKDQEDLNEIRNNRPDDATLIDSLLSGSF